MVIIDYYNPFDLTGTTSTTETSPTASSNNFIEDITITAYPNKYEECQELIREELSKKELFKWHEPRKIPILKTLLTNQNRICCRNQLPYKIREVNCHDENSFRKFQ